MDLYKAMLQELKRREIAHVEDFAPFYISSIGTHVFNLVNQKKRIWKMAGFPVNARQHVMFVAPAGFGKSLFIGQFLKYPILSILNGTSIDCAFEGSITGEASLIGSVIGIDEQDKPIIKYGLAHEHRNSIVGCEEFSAITAIANKDYAGALDQALLLLLDSGDVLRRLAATDIAYHSDMTLWGGVQPARYDLSSGLGRRLIFMVFHPTQQDLKDFRIALIKMENVKIDQSKMTILHQELDKRFREIQNQLTGVSFTQEFYKLMHQMNIVHYEIPLYQRLALGYWLMKLDRIGGDLVVGLDDELKRIIHLQKTYRRSAKEGTTIGQVIAIIREKKEREIERDELYAILEDLSLNLEQIRDLLTNMVNLKWITVYNKPDGSVWVKLLKT